MSISFSYLLSLSFSRTPTQGPATRTTHGVCSHKFGNELSAVGWCGANGIDGRLGDSGDESRVELKPVLLRDGAQNPNELTRISLGSAYRAGMTANIWGIRVTPGFLFVV